MKIFLGLSLLFCFGFTAAVSAEEHRIVSLAPSITTMIGDLGMGGALVGVTQFCRKPDSAKNAVVVGTLSTVNYELIVSLKPTIVFTDNESNRSDSIDRISLMGVKTIKLGPYKTIEDIILSYEAMGDALGKAKTAESDIAASRKRIKTVEDKLADAAQKKVFIEIWPKPLRTASTESYLNALVEMAGGANVITGIPVPYPQVSLETVIAKKPDVILILTHSMINDSRISEYRKFPAFHDIEIEQLESSTITQPSLSASIGALETLAKVIHPNAFSNSTIGEHTGNE